MNNLISLEDNQSVDTASTCTEHTEAQSSKIIFKVIKVDKPKKINKVFATHK